jgi:hypothetical protein
MSKVLLALHVLAAIIAIGPVTVAASMFPPAVRQAAEQSAAGSPSATTVQLLHRICRRYAGLGLAVPVLGMATASVMGVLGSTWLIMSMVLTAAAAGILVALVLPRQEALLDRLGSHQLVDRGHTAQLGMYTGLFNLLWATVTVLMIVRPGSTTGA